MPQRLSVATLAVAVSAVVSWASATWTQATGPALAQVAALPAGVPGAFTDAYGRVEWARLGAAAAFVSVVFGVVLSALLPALRDRLRTVQWGGKAAAGSVDALCEAIESHPARFVQTVDRLYATSITERRETLSLAKTAAADADAIRHAIDEAKLLTLVPSIELNVKSLQRSIEELTHTLKDDAARRTRERVSDREEFVRLQENVRIITTPGYQGPGRRTEDWGPYPPHYGYGTAPHGPYAPPTPPSDPTDSSR